MSGHLLREEHALTAGLGWGFVEDAFASLVVMLGGATRTFRTAESITENWSIVGTDGAVLSGGLRLFSERLPAEAGFIGLVSTGDPGCRLPLANPVFHLGAGR
jgi:hypothetical protein